MPKRTKFSKSHKKTTSKNIKQRKKSTRERGKYIKMEFRKKKAIKKGVRKKY